MRKFLFYAFILVASLSACDLDTDSLGTSVVDYDDIVGYETKTYNLVTETDTVSSDYAINARSMYSYIGCMNDQETNSLLEANYMTQFVAQKGYQYFPAKSKLLIQPTETECNSVDSCYIAFATASFYGDSLAKMKVLAHELIRPYEEGVKYSIDFDPAEEGMIWEPDMQGSVNYGGIEGTTSYTMSNTIYRMIYPSSYSHIVEINLNKPFVRNGVKYNNYGSYLMDMYYKDSVNFSSPLLFSKNVCHGFYLENVYGEGAMGQVTATELILKFRYHKTTESTDTVYTLFAGTKEAIQHSTLHDSGRTKEMMKESADKNSDYTYVKSPLGIYTKVTFDVDSIIDNEHAEDTLSTVRVFFPRINNTSDSYYAQQPPAQLLLVRTDSIHAFFSKEKLYDGRTSFVADYSSSTNGYTFGNVATLITMMKKVRNDWYNEHYPNYAAMYQIVYELQTKKEEGKTLTSDEQAQLDKYTKEIELIDQEFIKEKPNWNTALLVPIESTSNTTGTLLSITHSMLMQCTKLKKGTDNNAVVQASIIYSSFK